MIFVNTYGLLDFELVDRTKERNEIKRFIQSDTKFLWLNGDSDTGKSFLATQFRWKEYNYDYIHTEVAGQSEYNLYENIVCELNQKFNYQFKSFILSNYSGLYNLVKSTVSSTIENVLLKDHDFLKKLYGEFVLLVDKEGVKKNISKVLAQYINEISINNPLVLIIDDVSLFDNANFNLLKELIFELDNFKKIKIIIITNKEKENTQINNFLTEKLPCDYMLIEPFSDEIFFAEIILPKFPNDKQIISYIPRIFDICEGFPERLKILFQNILLNDQRVLRISNSNISINCDCFDNYLNNYEKQGINGYSLLEKLILKLVISLTSPINTDFLIRETIFIGENVLSHTFEYIQIIDAVNNLLELQILRKISNAVIIFNESVQKKLLANLKDNVPDIDMVNHYVYVYLLSLENNMMEKETCPGKYLELLSLYAYLGHEEHWVSYNYQYGIVKVNNHEFSVASKIFDRLENYFDELKANDVLFVGECYYNNGEYNKAYNVLKLINKDKLTNEKKFRYHYICGKCNFILLNANCAAEQFARAESVAANLDEKFLAINMKIQSYREYSKGPNDAENAYKDYLNMYWNLVENPDLKSLPKCLSGFLRNSLFFLPLDEASDLCQKAIYLSEKHDDFVNIAFAKNNYAYCLIKQNNIKKAKNYYIEAYNMLSNFRVHETAYCLNNIAVCNMFEENYEEALRALTKAALVSTSFYANYCIDTHTMICNLKLFREKTALELANNLYNKIDNKEISDLTILRRVNMNLCIAYYKLGDKIKAIECLNKVKPISEGTLSEFRANYYAKLLKQNYSMSNDNGITHDIITEFEPWLIMFSHD